MRILFAGTPAVSATVLEGLVHGGHEVVAVLTREDAPFGRKGVSTPSPVSEKAEELKIPVIKANKIDFETLSAIKHYDADLAIVVAFGIILKSNALSIIPKGWFNLHFSILPKWRGAAPVQRAIQAGEKITGITMFKINEGMDTGPILGTLQTEIQPEETAGELLNRLGILGVSLLGEQLPRIYSGVYELEEQVGEPSLAPKLTRAEARINFDDSASVIDCQVRAMNPEPMAWCFNGEATLRVIRARASSLKPTEIGLKDVGSVGLINNQVLVCCGSNTVIELIEVQPASKGVMKAVDWFNGQQKLEVLT